MEPADTYLILFVLDNIIWILFLTQGQGHRLIFSSPVRKYIELLVVTLTSASALVSHFKVLLQSCFMLWARSCQVSYLVQGQVLLNIYSICVNISFY